MKIWELAFDINKYDRWGFISELELLNGSNSLKGQKLLDRWKPAKIKRIGDDKGKGANALRTSFTMPLVDLKVFSCIIDFVKDSVELLPTILVDEGYDSETFYILNVINRLDCIDFETSDYERFTCDGKIMYFKKRVFKEHKVKGEHIFVAKGDRPYEVYISDELKQTLENSGLKGFKFKLIWDSEDEKAVEEFENNEWLMREEKEKAHKLIKAGKLIELPEDEWVTVVLDWIWGKLYESSEELFIELQNLPLPCQYIFSMYTLKYQIENGGYNQFFYNYDVGIAKLAEKGFIELELEYLDVITADAIESYNEMSEKYKRGEDDSIEDFMDTYSANAFNSLTGYFMSTISLRKLGEKSIEYIRENIQCFGDKE